MGVADLFPLSVCNPCRPPVVGERPRAAAPRLEEWMRPLRADRRPRRGAAKVGEDNEPFAPLPVDVRLRDLPRGLEELRVRLRRARSADVVHEHAVPEEGKPPAVPVTP